MRARTFKGYKAPGTTELWDAKEIGAEIMRGILYDNKAICKRQDCLDGEKPAYITVLIKVDHGSKK